MFIIMLQSQIENVYVCLITILIQFEHDFSFSVAIAKI